MNNIEKSGKIGRVKWLGQSVAVVANRIVLRRSVALLEIRGGCQSVHDWSQLSAYGLR